MLMYVAKQWIFTFRHQCTVMPVVSAMEYVKVWIFLSGHFSRFISVFKRFATYFPFVDCSISALIFLPTWHTHIYNNGSLEGSLIVIALFYFQAPALRAF